MKIRQILESVSVGGMGTGSIATAPAKAGKMIKREKGNLLAQEDQGVEEVSLGDYRKKAAMQKAQSQMGAMFARDPAEREKNVATFNKREKGLNRLKARDEKARTADQQKQMADLVARLPELEAEYERMKAEYKSLGGSNWQYADREQNLTPGERKARDMEGAMNNLWRQIQAAKKHQSVAEGSLEEMNRRGFLKGLAGAGAALAAGGAIAKGYNPIYAEKKKKEREEREKARPEQPGNHQQIPKPKPRDSYNSIPKEGVAEGYQLDEGAVETITNLAKKIPGIGKYYQLAQQMKPQLIQILKTSRSGKEVKQKMEQLAAQQSTPVAEGGLAKQLGGMAVGGGAILSTMWMNAMGMIDGVLAHAAAGEVGGAIASGSILGLIPVTLMLFAAMLLFKGSKQSSDDKAQAVQDQRRQQGVAEGLEQVYKVVALTKSNALAKPTKMKVKADSIEDLFGRLAANDWYPLEINGVEVIAGKRLKQGVAEVKDLPGKSKMAGATPMPAPNLALKDIITSHMDEVRSVLQSEEIDPTGPLFYELYEYFANEIPESVRRDPRRLERRILNMVAPYLKFYGGTSMNEQGVAEGDKKPHPKTWHDVDAKLGKQVDKMSQAEKVRKGLAHPDTLKKDKDLEENKKGVRAVKHTAKPKGIEPPKPRNFVAKNAKMGGAGQHKDKKKAAKQGDTKHKQPAYESRLWAALERKILK